MSNHLGHRLAQRRIALGKNDGLRTCRADLRHIASILGKGRSIAHHIFVPQGTQSQARTDRCACTIPPVSVTACRTRWRCCLLGPLRSDFLRWRRPSIGAYAACSPVVAVGRRTLSSNDKHGCTRRPAGLGSHRSGIDAIGRCAYVSRQIRRQKRDPHRKSERRGADDRQAGPMGVRADRLAALTNL